MRGITLFLVLFFVLVIFADDDGKKMAEWLSLGDALRSNERKEKPLIVLVAPKESGFIEDVEKFFGDRRVKSAASRFIKVFIDSTEENEDLEKLGLSKGDEYLLIYDYQLVKRESFESLPDEKREFTDLLREVRKSNDAKRKVMAKAEKLYETAESYFKKENYAKTIPALYALQKIKEAYDAQHEEDGDCLQDEIFDKAEEMLKAVEAEFGKMLREAESLRRKRQFGKALVILSKARTQFSQLEGADEEITRLEEAIQREIERYRKDK